MLKLTTRTALALLLAGMTASACSDGADSPPARGDAILEQAREAHGSDRLDNAVVEFDFRGDHYTVRHNGGLFSYQRTYVGPSGRTVREVLTNDSLYQTVDGSPRRLSNAQRLSIETTVNSVVYFALLPHALDDPAVQSRYLGATSIHGAPYHEVEVTFQREGGGRDWQDRFIYWIHRTRNTMDFLAYYYHTDGGGSRFREAVNVRRVDGIRFADYVNYTVPGDSLKIDAVDSYDELFEADSLEKVSDVKLENIAVRPLDESTRD